MKLISLGAVSAAGLHMYNSSKMRTFFRKIRGRFSTDPPLPDTFQAVDSFNDEGSTISVETALNSRCSSDYDEKPEIFHWGMFDRNRRLTDELVRSIPDYVAKCRLTEGNVSIEAGNAMLYFVINNTVSGSKRDGLMVESGMQQQAVALICAAFGIGNLLKNEGMDGKQVSDTEFITIGMQIDAMKPSYNNAYWTVESPEGEASWISGNLPDPVRKGSVPLLKAMKHIHTQNKGIRKADRNDLGQLLWAMRGRTPHFYKSTPWGMTIPTWSGSEIFTRIFVLDGANLFVYRNWQKGHPTHSLDMAGTVNDSVIASVKQMIPDWNMLLIVSAEDTHARALWETGYQVTNFLVQAYALGISYRVILPDNDQKVRLKSVSIQDPAAIICI